MSAYAVKRIDEMEGIYGGAFKRARAELGVESFGMAIIDMPPNFERYPTHDHGEDGQEEVFVALRGGGQIEIEGERFPLDADHVARVGPGVKRKVCPATTASASSSSAARPASVYTPRRPHRARRTGPDGSSTSLAADDDQRRGSCPGHAPDRQPAGSAGRRGPVRERSHSEKTEPRVLGTSLW